MKLRQFEFLCMLKEHGSISKVAEEAYTSQPTVSIAIKELESELGFPLLRRTNRGTHFTERGELVLEQAQAIMRALEQIIRVSTCPDGELTGTLRVGALPHLCNTLLLSAQLELQDRYPDFTLQLQGSEGHTLIRLLDRGALDLIVVQDCELMGDHLHQLRADKLRFEPLFEDELTFVAAEGHPLLSKTHLTLDDMRGYPFAVFGDCDNRLVMSLTQEMGYPDAITRFYEMVRMRKYMEYSHAVTVLPRRAVVHGNMNYHIKFRQLHLDGLNWTTQVGWMHRGKELSAMERLVIDNLKQQCLKPEFLSLS